MPKIIGLVSLALLLALFLGVNITADRALAGARLDLTEGRLYTIRDATKRIARSPDEPVRLTFYYSRDLARGIPQIESFGRRVGEMLGAIAASSNGRVVLETVNPEPFSEAEDEAVAEGIQPQPVSQTENLYFGLVATNSLDGRETIPLFRPQEERFLEYRVAQLIAKLAEPDKPTLGLLTGLPMTGGFDPRTQRPTPEWAVLRELGATFEVETIPPTAAELPGGLDALMIVHPKDLPESLVYSIDQYILGGGGAIVFVDPVAESEQVAQQMGMPMGQDRSSDLPDLFGAWGVAYDRTQLVGDLDLAISVRAPGPRQDIVPYIVWLNAGAEQMDPDDPVTGNLSRLNIATAGAFSLAEDAPASLQPLLTTSDQSAFVPATSVQGFPDPASMLNDFFPDGETRTIAARITGTVPSAFPDGPPAGDTAEENTRRVGRGEPSGPPSGGPPRRVERADQCRRRRGHRHPRGRGLGPRAPPGRGAAGLRHPRRQRGVRGQCRGADGGQPRPAGPAGAGLVQPPVHAHRADAAGGGRRVPRPGADARGRDRAGEPADQRPADGPHRHGRLDTRADARAASRGGRAP
jgi:ABC-type uncharacterized transport system involved in gliding motility auxiliary subunit